MKKDRASERIPSGAIAADLSQQVPNNSYSPPPAYYIDEPFICVDCQHADVWTARQQKWYYEVAKGSLYATANRCPECRRKRRERVAGGDPEPAKHLGTLMKHVLAAINPTLAKAGFRLERKIANSFSPTALLEFSRPNEIVVVSYQRPEGNPRLVAESVSDEAGHVILACLELTPTSDVHGEIERLANAVHRHFDCDGMTDDSVVGDDSDT